jgi:hypothetical protein
MNTCKECTWWVGFSSGGMGYCHRFPPTVVNDGARCVYPTVLAGDYCGEHSVCSTVRATLPTSILQLQLSVRAENVLARNGVHTVNQLVELGERNVSEFKGFGETSVREVRRKLAEEGIVW